MNIKNVDTRMFNSENWSPKTWPKQAKGVGLSEAPRGALTHRIVIQYENSSHLSGTYFFII